MQPNNVIPTPETSRPPQSPGQVYTPPSQPAPAVHPQTYDFIINPEKSSTPRVPLPGANSLLTRVIIIAGGFIILLITFNIIKGLVGGSSNLPSMVTVAQDQQELVHLATTAGQQQNLSINNQNFVATVQVSLASAQSQLLTYLSANGKKVDPKVLNLQVSSTIDAQLTTAQAAATYDQTLDNVMKTKLTNYRNDLHQSFQLTKGKKGQALLSNDYAQAGLLLVQLSSPAS